MSFDERLKTWLLIPTRVQSRIQTYKERIDHLNGISNIWVLLFCCINFKVVYVRIWHSCLIRGLSCLFLFFLWLSYDKCVCLSYANQDMNYLCFLLLAAFEIVSANISCHIIGCKFNRHSWGRQTMSLLPITPSSHYALLALLKKSTWPYFEKYFQGRNKIIDAHNDALRDQNQNSSCAKLYQRTNAYFAVGLQVPKFL